MSASHPKSGRVATRLHAVEAAVQSCGTAAPTSDFCSLGKEQSVLNIYSKITNRMLDLRMAEQDLDSANVSGRAVNYRGLGPS